MHSKCARACSSCGSVVWLFDRITKFSFPVSHAAPNPPRLGQMEHPSILEHFDSFAEHVAGKRLVVFLDYDGTLTPIVNQPERAYMSDEMRSIVKTVSGHCQTAIISGRGREKLFEFVKLPELVYAGSHGMDISDGFSLRGTSNAQASGTGRLEAYCAAEKFKDTMDDVFSALSIAVRDIPNAEVENNKFCVSVHYRNCDPAMYAAVQACVDGVVARYDCLRMTKGRKVFEVRPNIEWDKGKAVEYLLDVFGLADSPDVLPIYIGDDRTDEDAFRVLKDRGSGLGILVSNVAKQTLASYTLQNPSEVMQFLKLLAENQASRDIDR